MKKNEVFMILGILIVGIIIISIIAVNKSKKAEEQNNNNNNNNSIQTENQEEKQEKDYSQTSLSKIDLYKKINIDDVKRVELVSSTEAKYLTKKITDKDGIKDIYTKLGMVELKEATNTRTSDDDFTVRFIYNENEKVTFFFEKNNIVIGNSQYQTEGLTRIKILLK